MKKNSSNYRVTLLLLLIIFTLSFMPSCSTSKSHIAANELLGQIKAEQAPLIVDVRSQSEYTSSHVPGALHIPFWAAFTSSQLDQADKTRALVIYCEHGPRAGIAKMAFSWSGFDKIYYLEGHMLGWKKLKLPVDKGLEE